MIHPALRMNRALIGLHSSNSMKHGQARIQQEVRVRNFSRSGGVAVIMSNRAIVVVACAVMTFARAEAMPMGPYVPDLNPGFVELTPLAEHETKSASNPDGWIQVGVVRPFNQAVVTDAAASTHGLWSTLADGTRVWTLVIHAPGAVGQRIHFNQAVIPPGGRLYVYDAFNSGEYYDVLASANGRTEDIWAPMCFSDVVAVECVLPPGVSATDLLITVDQTAHAHDFFGANAAAKGSDPCHPDVTCFPEWAEAASGVGGISLIANSGLLVATGTLLKDTDPNTDIPYFLTARHVVGAQATANNVEVYWLYQSSVCDGAAPDINTVPRTVGGADLLASGTDLTSTDYALLRLNNDPPSGVAYLGWSVVGNSLNDGAVSIHQPLGEHKRIAFGITTNIVDSCLIEQPASSRFYQIDWTNGLTENVSDGAPLFNMNQQVVGQLLGGGGSCAAPDCPAYFGRFDITFPNIASFLAPNGTVPQFNFAKPVFNVKKDDGFATVTVTATGQIQSGLNAAVSFSTADGTAIAGEQYVSTSGLLVFEAGDTEKSFQIPIIDDPNFDGLGSLTILLTLGDPLAAAIGSANPTATVAIGNNNLSQLPSLQIPFFSN